MTVQQLIEAAMHKINVVAAGESPSPDESALGLVTLNIFVDTMNVNKALVYSRATETFALSATAAYTMGPTGAFATVRPVKITEAGVIVSGIRVPIEIVPVGRYRALFDKAATSLAPVMLACDYASPLTNIWVWPVPSATPTLELVSWKQLANFTLQNGAAITTVSKAAAAVCSATAHGLLTGDGVLISGATGTGWSAINALFPVTRLNDDTFSIPVNSSGFGTLAGTVVFSTAVIVPPGYLDALILNLAVKLAPDFGQQALAMAQAILPLAERAKADLAALNLMNENALNDLPQQPRPGGQ